MPRLQQLLAQGQKLVQEGALTALASVADSCKTSFAPFYNQVFLSCNLCTVERAPAAMAACQTAVQKLVQEGTMTLLSVADSCKTALGQFCSPLNYRFGLLDWLTPLRPRTA